MFESIQNRRSGIVLCARYHILGVLLVSARVSRAAAFGLLGDKRLGRETMLHEQPRPMFGLRILRIVMNRTRILEYAADCLPRHFERNLRIMWTE